MCWCWAQPGQNVGTAGDPPGPCSPGDSSRLTHSSLSQNKNTLKFNPSLQLGGNNSWGEKCNKIVSHQFSFVRGPTSAARELYPIYSSCQIMCIYLISTHKPAWSPIKINVWDLCRLEMSFRWIIRHSNSFRMALDVINLNRYSNNNIRQRRSHGAGEEVVLALEKSSSTI